MILLDFIKIIALNLINYSDVEDIDDNHCHNVIYKPKFDTKIFNWWLGETLTHLTLLYIGDYIKDKHISCLKSLQYLDLGIRNYFTNDAIIGLYNLETLYIRDNEYITEEIFKTLKKIKTFQISFQSYFRFMDMPKVPILITSTYDYVCDRYDVYKYEVDRKIEIL